MDLHRHLWEFFESPDRGSRHGPESSLRTAHPPPPSPNENPTVDPTLGATLEVSGLESVSESVFLSRHDTPPTDDGPRVRRHILPGPGPQERQSAEGGDSPQRFGSAPRRTITSTPSKKFRPPGPDPLEVRNSRPLLLSPLDPQSNVGEVRRNSIVAGDGGRGGRNREPPRDPTAASDPPGTSEFRELSVI